MSKSLAAVFEGTPGRLELREFPTPEPKGAEVLVRVLGCTLCGSDLHSCDGRRKVAVPTVLGHEIVGEIVAFGQAASTRDFEGHELRVGDRVTWSIVASCGDCFFCNRGLPQKCLRSTKYGHEALRPGYELLGGLAEHCLLAAGTAIVRLPDDLPLEVACPANCATATVAAALEAAGELRERHVLVLGMGLLGLTATAMLHASGAEAIGVDIEPGRRARALKFGASQFASPDQVADIVARATESRGVDVVLELSGSTAAFEAAWPLVRLGGKIVLVGSVFPGPPTPMHLEQIVRRNLTIVGVHNYASANLMSAVRFLNEHHDRYPFANLVADWYPLTDVAQAFQAAHDPDNIRVGVRPDGTQG